MTDITIPPELAIYPLDLEEIGAIVVLMILPQLDTNTVIKWKDDDKFMEIVNRLIIEGIVIPSVNDGDLNIEIDLR